MVRLEAPRFPFTDLPLEPITPGVVRCPACLIRPRPPDSDVCRACEDEIALARVEYLEGLECPTCLGPLEAGVYCETCGQNWR